MQDESARTVLETPPYLSHFLCLKPVLCEVPIF
uniref:Uncharacterized protein n=1 Tax=Anguilla anguilla TaxID=7936 RepID=A0A0E9T2X0_ANGAN